MKPQIYSTRLPATRRLSVIQILQLCDSDMARHRSVFERNQMRLTLRNNIDTERHWLSNATTFGAREKCKNVIYRLSQALKKIPTA
jgi:hypothetical protein